MGLVTKFSGNEIISCESVNSRIREINDLFPVSIANGGTGATTIEQARANLNFEGYMLLYQNISGTTNTITLPEKAAECNRWGIFYGINNIGSYQECDLATVTYLNLTDVYLSGSNNLYYRTAIAQINKNARTITLSRNSTFVVRADGGHRAVDESLNIYNVIGFK